MKNTIINIVNIVRMGNAATPTLRIRVTYSKDTVTINRVYSVSFLINKIEERL